MSLRLTREEEQILLRQAQSDGPEREPARERLLASLRDLIHRLAHRVPRSPRLAYEDVVQEGCLAVLLAIDRYRPEFGTRLISSAHPAIVRQMQKAQRHTEPIPVPEYLYQRGVADHHLIPVCSLDVPAHFDGGDTGDTLGDILAGEADVEADWETGIDRVWLYDQISRLPEAEAHAWRRRLQDWSMQQIGDEMGYSREGVRHILNRGLHRLKAAAKQADQE